MESTCCLAHVNTIFHLSPGFLQNPTTVCHRICGKIFFKWKILRWKRVCVFPTRWSPTSLLYPCACSSWHSFSGMKKLAQYLGQHKPRTFASDKNVLYAENKRDINHLQRGIFAAVEPVTSTMLENTWRGVKYCLDVYRATNVFPVEVY